MMVQIIAVFIGYSIPAVVWFVWEVVKEVRFERRMAKTQAMADYLLEHHPDRLGVAMQRTMGIPALLHRALREQMSCVEETRP